ncbi:hypothetical protein MUK42_10370 [Musa troglodytarum]|uniref:Uncharacterized protein n=1 Tax=Musa troglodytarum TaxID=320322 RepID=A0A9E7FKK0_9LILI|nr:hypothetical protein MUK42_10370 [Musa troglodytarum]
MRNGKETLQQKSSLLHDCNIVLKRLELAQAKTSSVECGQELLGGCTEVGEHRTLPTVGDCRRSHHAVPSKRPSTFTSPAHGDKRRAPSPIIPRSLAATRRESEGREAFWVVLQVCMWVTACVRACAWGSTKGCGKDILYALRNIKKHRKDSKRASEVECGGRPKKTLKRGGQPEVWLDALKLRPGLSPCYAKAKSFMS